jgi:hypothetical protein
MVLVHPLAKVSIELIATYFHFFEIFNIQIEEMAFYKPDFEALAKILKVVSVKNILPTLSKLLKSNFIFLRDLVKQLASFFIFTIISPIAIIYTCKYLVYVTFNLICQLQKH